MTILWRVSRGSCPFDAHDRLFCFLGLKLPTHIPRPDHEEGRDSPYATTIVHLSVRPVAPPTDDGLSKKKGRRRTRSENGVEEEEEQGGCCSGCVIC